MYTVWLVRQLTDTQTTIALSVEIMTSRNVFNESLVLTLAHSDN